MRRFLAHARGKTYSKLSGVIALYKPQGISTSSMIRNVKAKLLTDLNENYRHEIKAVKQLFLVNWSLDRERVEEKFLQTHWAIETSDLEKQVMDVLSVNAVKKFYDISQNVGETDEVKRDAFLETYTNLSLLAYS